ncbi:MAG: hypothetical protein PWP34_153 [Desulfuromonadales bacterium]|jgi:uncharacterized protein YbbK (DUF523 family)|nr:hypothetical protein [Desulfuromonadales bacterium]
MSQTLLVSACLLGLLTRYDGQSKTNPKVLDYLQRHDLTPIPVCPEQLAGLSTPRPLTFFAAGSGPEVLDGSGKIVNTDRADMNNVFIKGAEQTLQIARLVGCKDALLKDGSPSCGVHRICRNGTRTAGQGITTALLQRSGLHTFSEEDL